MLSNYQLKIADSDNIPIGTVKKLVPNFFDKETHVLYYLRLGLTLKNTLCLRIQSITMAKTICRI